jgi:hypothetical protein
MKNLVVEVQDNITQKINLARCELDSYKRNNFNEVLFHLL